MNGVPPCPPVLSCVTSFPQSSCSYRPDAVCLVAIGKWGGGVGKGAIGSVWRVFEAPLL